MRDFLNKENESYTDGSIFIYFSLYCVTFCSHHKYPRIVLSLTLKDGTAFSSSLLRSQMTFSCYHWAPLTCLGDLLPQNTYAEQCSRGKWIIYKNLSWHLLSNVERWRQNSCYCCRKQSAGDWIKVSRKWLLDGLLFSLIQLDVSLSCQLGITAVWFINRRVTFYFR